VRYVCKVLAQEGIRVSTSMFTDHFPDIIGKGLRDAHRAFQSRSGSGFSRDRGGSSVHDNRASPLRPTADRG
jgi:hypothetical protein